MNLEQAAARLEAFGGLQLTARIAGIESNVRGASGPEMAGLLAADVMPEHFVRLLAAADTDAPGAAGSTI